MDRTVLATTTCYLRCISVWGCAYARYSMYVFYVRMYVSMCIYL
jgi:hypothetical protein